MKQNKKKELESGSYGTASLVTGIIGLIFLPIIFSPLAVIFGAIGIGKEQKFSKAGLTLGIMGCVGIILVFAFFFSVFMSLLA